MLRHALTEKKLSRREIEVAEKVSMGLANKEVANVLFVTEKTIKFHLTNIFKKLQMKSRAQLIVWASEQSKFSGGSKLEKNLSVEAVKELPLLNEELPTGAKMHSGFGNA